MLFHPAAAVGQADMIRGGGFRRHVKRRVELGGTESDHVPGGDRGAGGTPHGHAPLHDPGLLRGDLLEGVSEVFRVLERDAGDDGNERRDDVRGVQAAAHADLPDDIVAFRAGEEQRRDERGDLEIRGLHAVLFELGDGGQHRVLHGRDVVPGHGTAVDAESFAGGNEVRRGVESGAEPGCAEPGLDHRADGALAVAPGDVDEFEAALGRPGGTEQRARLLQPQLDPEEFKRGEPIGKSLFRHGRRKRSRARVISGWGTSRNARSCPGRR